MMAKLRNANVQESRKTSRRKKKSLYVNGSSEQNTIQQKISYRRRHRSCELNIQQKKDESLQKFRRKSRPSSASSLNSIIYIGRFKKVPKLIVLDDSSDKERSQIYKNKLRKCQISNCPSFKQKKDKNFNNTRNILHNENDLLNMLQKMHINTSIMNTIFDCSKAYKNQT